MSNRFSYNSFGIEGTLFEVDKTHERLKKIMESRLRNTRKTSGETEQLHQDILTTMREVIPTRYQDGLETEVYLKPEGLMFEEGIGCTAEKDGKRVVIVSDEVLTGVSSVNYREFLSHNLKDGRRVKPEDFFKNIAAHEYGHILFGDRLSEDVKWNLPYGLLGKSLVALDDGELSEGFAFWFGDLVSDTKTSIREVANTYRNRLSPKKIVGVYTELQELSDKLGPTETIKQMPQYLADKLTEGNESFLFSPYIIRGYLGGK